jgi:hypothetical protein
MDITGNQLYEETGITMFHASYVSPKAVHDKIEYYENAVIKPGDCIPNYYNDVFLPWVLYPAQRQAIEDKWNGVQEFMPSVRGESKTMPYEGHLPYVIVRDYKKIMERIGMELQDAMMKAGL